jgi:hypothetical protein
MSATDGGGIRGYSSLLILAQLMTEISLCETRLQETLGPVPGSTRRTFNANELLPCHYFDYMYGTSTGGLIAVMLARLRMTVPQCLEVYRTVGQDLFGHRRSWLPLATKYNHRPLENAVREVVKRHCKEHVDDEEEEERVVKAKTPDGITSLGNSSTWSSAAGRSIPAKPVERICQSYVPSYYSSPPQTPH